MKKLLHFLSQTLQFIVWSYIYTLLINTILIYFWNFNLFSSYGWQLIFAYWNSGGIINTWQDYLLILIIIAYIPLWLIGWKKIRKINLLQIIVMPFTLYRAHQLAKYEEKTSHITIKNMGTESIKVEEEIERRSKPKTKIATDENVNNIRAEVTKKINSVKNVQS